MHQAIPPERLERLLLEAGLNPDRPLRTDGGRQYRTWQRGGEPVIMVAEDGDAGDAVQLHRLAWTFGCRWALVALEIDRIGLIGTTSPPSAQAPPRLRVIDAPRLRTILAGIQPCSNPGIVDVLVERMGEWRRRNLWRALSDRTDWNEEELLLSVEMPILDLLTGERSGSRAGYQMDAELASAGVDPALIPPGLLALAWDRHLSWRLRFRGGEPTLVPSALAPSGQSRALLWEFARWAGEESGDAHSVLVPGCGAGRLLLHVARWERAKKIRLYAVDPDPRATLFAARLVERVSGGPLSLSVRTANPLVEQDLFDGPLGQLVPGEARSRLRPIDWENIFDGTREFDRILIGDPTLTMTRRQEVRRYLEERYRSAASDTDRALLLAEAGAARLSPGGRVLVLYPSSILRSERALLLRRWLAPRTESYRISSFDPEAIALKVAPDPIDEPIVMGRLDGDPSDVRAYPRSILQANGWSFPDIRTMERRRWVVPTGCTPLGEALVGGIRPAEPFVCNPSLLVGRDVRRRLVRADRRAARNIRPFFRAWDLVRYGTERDAVLFLIAGTLPPRAFREARRLGLSTDDLCGSVPPPSGPRLLFEDGMKRPVFLFDRSGGALTAPGIAEVVPGNLFLLGLLHSALVGAFLDERCPGGVTIRCLSRLPVRLPDPYDPRESSLYHRIVSLVRARIGPVTGVERDQQRCRAMESGIEEAVEHLYHPSPVRQVGG
ncbi:MAG TPA: hypothetical protein PK089_05895 [Methanoregulaceae archaeon]|nr:hypothetical protein [Methanoregulaceae archaeon]HQJ87734.1 hypothetical protein [Methanoregulaceae archaeon]